MSATERRIADLEGFIYPISWDVPPPKDPEALLDKASELAIKLRIWQGKKADSKAMRNRRLLAISEGRAQPQYYNNPDYYDRKTQRKERKAEQKARRGRSSSGKLKGRVAKADRLEQNATSDIVWAVILNVDQGLESRLSSLKKYILIPTCISLDAEIEGRDLVDDLQDEEIGKFFFRISFSFF